MISICMATYNGEKYIKQQINSILPQLGKEDEIVVSDNDSTDRTVEILKSYNDSRIKIFNNPRVDLHLIKQFNKDKTITNNFENALRHCNGDYIFFCDQDDIWFENKILMQVPLLEKYDLVMSNATLIDAAGVVIRERLYDENPLRHGIFSFRARGCLLGITRHLVKYFLPVPKVIFYHDLWAGQLAEYLGSTYFLEEPLIYHRRGIGNASTDVTQKSLRPLWFKIYYRILYIICGFIRTRKRF